MNQDNNARIRNLGKVLEVDMSSLEDSFTGIKNILDQNETSPNSISFVERNTKHLELMLNKINIQNSDKDLSKFIDILALAKAFLAEPLT